MGGRRGGPPRSHDRIRRDLATKGVPRAMSHLVSQVERDADISGAD